MYCKNDILRNSENQLKDNILNRGIVWDGFRPACKKQFAKNKNHSVVGVAKLSDGKSCPGVICPTRFGEVDQETHGLRLCFTKMTKIRSVYSGPPGCRAAPCTPRLLSPDSGTRWGPSPRLAFHHHLKGRASNICLCCSPPSPSSSLPPAPAATPPRPPPRRTSKTASAVPVLIWDKWDLCSTKGA